jgi:hypothetical protein
VKVRKRKANTRMGRLIEDKTIEDIQNAQTNIGNTIDGNTIEDETEWVDRLKVGRWSGS